MFSHSGVGDYYYDYYNGEYDYHYNEIDRHDTFDTTYIDEENDRSSRNDGQKVSDNMLNCEATSAWSGQPAMRQWCNDNCNHVPKNCPASMCVCKNSFSELSNKVEIVNEDLICKPTKPYQSIPGMARWCDDNCNGITKFCPETYCTCM